MEHVLGINGLIYVLVFYCEIMSDSFPCSVCSDRCEDHCIQYDVSRIIFYMSESMAIPTFEFILYTQRLLRSALSDQSPRVRLRTQSFFMRPGKTLNRL